MHTQTEARACLSCGKTVKGRSDKKFCDDYCRNVYNNTRKTESEPALVKQVNAALRRNRGLLQKLLGPEEMTKMPRKKMIDAGFSFQYLTHQYINKKGNVYHFVYEYGYLELEGDWILLVKREQ